MSHPGVLKTLKGKNCSIFSKSTPIVHEKKNIPVVILNLPTYLSISGGDTNWFIMFAQ